MFASLLLLASSALALGTSPFVDPGHEHEWIAVMDEADGQGWLDATWRDTLERDDEQLQLVLLRVQFNEPDNVMQVDFVMAVDCSARLLGINEAFIHTSPGVTNMMAPAQELTMDFAATPPSEEDNMIIDAACEVTDPS